VGKSLSSCHQNKWKEKSRERPRATEDGNESDPQWYIKGQRNTGQTGQTD
jgi:hypothetical protein